MEEANNVTPISAARKIMDAPHVAAGTADRVQVHEAVAPPEHGPLEYGQAQVAALVLVEGGDVACIPPQTFACVRQKGEGGGVVALVGPRTDLGSVRDAVVFSQAFALRNALRETVIELRAFTQGERGDMIQDVITRAEAVLNLADPHFLAVQPTQPETTAEQRLAEAREHYDPSLNPSTAHILADGHDATNLGQPTLSSGDESVVSGGGGDFAGGGAEASFDASPSSSTPDTSSPSASE